MVIYKTKQAGAVLGQAQLKLGLDFTSILCIKLMKETYECLDINIPCSTATEFAN